VLSAGCLKNKKKDQRESPKRFLMRVESHAFI